MTGKFHLSSSQCKESAFGEKDILFSYLDCSVLFSF
jgi:hypothetical protein